MSDLEQRVMAELAPRTERGVERRMIAALGLAGLLSGLLIVLAYEATLPRIEANRAAALREAVFQVVPGATAMQKLVLRDGKLVAAGDDATGDAIYAAYDASGAFVGYAIPGAGSGFQDTIRLIYGYAPQRQQVVGLAVLESKETPGLGDKIYKDPAFAQNFKALAVHPEVVVVKHGTKAAPHEVDGITGATISSKAVVKILNAGNQAWLDKLPAAGHEPPLPAGTAEEDHR